VTNRSNIGDRVAWLTKVLGIKECPRCKQRRAALNTLDMSRPAAELINGIYKSLANPERVLAENIKEALEKARELNNGETQDDSGEEEGTR